VEKEEISSAVCKLTAKKQAGCARAAVSLDARAAQGGGDRRMEAYCVKCKAKREMKNPEKTTMKNGKQATKGTCPTCGTKMFKIGG